MKVLKVVAGVVAGLLLVILVGVQVMQAKASSRLARTWDEVKGVEVPVPWPLSEAEIAALRDARARELAAQTAASAPPAGEIEATASAATAPDPLAGVDLQVIARQRAMARGKHLLSARLGCTECHGADFGGKVIMENGAMGRWAAPNISTAGVTKDYSTADWDRIIRHGIGKQGTSTTMPAVDFENLSDQELSDIITVITAAPAVDTPSVPSTLGPIRAMLIATGGIPVSAEVIDHNAARPKTPPAANADVTYGKHVATSCVGCHGRNFAGGPIEGGDPSWPAAANLTPDATGLQGWTVADFRAAVRDGKSKGGRTLHPIMPIGMMKNMTDVEVDGMFAFFQSLPPTPMGQR
jgi:mono/diheme cytochrome c family protein